MEVENMKLNKQKLLEMVEEELQEQSQFPSFTPAFMKALKIVQGTKPNETYVIPKGVDADTVKALFLLKQKNQLGNVKALQQLDKRTRPGLEVPKEFVEEKDPFIELAREVKNGDLTMEEAIQIAKGESGERLKKG
tara:strand:+ start:58 stop:465 length:408 start_codon:yes stop_codon:yes gene_type:complete